ncbi:precorrin-6A reductase [Alkalibacter rhizosphaerae]|uniref:Precorrin-6A reductase n=1 Tax=Alkalibacter rhizosphaerae TaxID=2815577 RepID=A0A974XFE6_9FIRM|nr:precorrin-6A reductase [Alkalibacter rhizosphaerae]QSX08818.1 precorrin-6A reductase [Alkalibacter rhizosphaerae]
MIVVFAGTKDGRDWVLDRLDQGEEIVVSVATAYGASLYPEQEKLQVVSGRKNLEEMKKFLLAHDPKRVVDWTHPYAVEVSRNIKKACEELVIPYGRIHRETSLVGLEHPKMYTFHRYEPLTEYLKKTKGNILWTIGSNGLDQVMIKDLIHRSYVRVLPTSQVLMKCEGLGLDPSRILGLQGPFSKELNLAIYRDYDIEYMVTKDSGKPGGTLEKVLPALEMGIQVLVYGRPVE